MNELLSLVQDLRDPDDDADGISPEDAERRQAATDYWREALQPDEEGFASAFK